MAVNDGGKLCEEIKELVGGRKNRTKHLRASIFANQRVDFFLNVFVKRYDIVQSVQNVAFLLRNSRCLVFDFIQQVEKAFDKAIIRQRKGDRLSLVVDFICLRISSISRAVTISSGIVIPALSDSSP